MPTITIYTTEVRWAEKIEPLLPELAERTAALLSTPEMALDGTHISIRVVVAHCGLMMSPVELEVTAHAFGQRLERQDEICGDLRQWLLRAEIPNRVWLRLSALGYGYQRNTAV